MFASVGTCIVIKIVASFDRFAIAIKRDIGENVDHALADWRTVSSVDGNIFKQLNSFSILCFRNRRCQIAVEVSSRYIQSDDTGFYIVVIFNKNIVYAGSYISLQSCAINQRNKRRRRVIGDVASYLCIVGNNYGRRIFFGAIRYNHITSDHSLFTGYG